MENLAASICSHTRVHKTFDKCKTDATQPCKLAIVFTMQVDKLYPSSDLHDPPELVPGATAVSEGRRIAPH